MLNDLVYIVLSILEGLIIINFSLSVFRMDTKRYTKEILITSIIVSLGTFFYKDSSWSSVSIFLNMIALILLFIIIFKISPIYSACITLFGFLACLIVQGVVALAVNGCTGLTLDEINSIVWLRSLLQFSSDAIVAMITVYIIRRRIGYTFVPFEFSVKVKLNKTNFAMIVSILIGSLIILYSLEFGSMAIGTTFWILGFLFILYAGHKKEEGRN